MRDVTKPRTLRLVQIAELLGVRKQRPPARRRAGLSGAELLHILMLPDFDRADAIGSYWGNPKTRTFAELLIDCEEDRVLRAVLVGMLRETDRGR